MGPQSIEGVSCIFLFSRIQVSGYQLRNITSSASLAKLLSLLSTKKTNYGFRSSRSTTDVWTVISHRSLKVTRTITLDISKAFDNMLACESNYLAMSMVLFIFITSSFIIWNSMACKINLKSFVSTYCEK